MKYLLYLSAAVLVVVCATWAYRVNYATQEALNRVADLDMAIAREHEAIGVLNAEWAYLNRPDRLRALVDANAHGLDLHPLTPDQFGEVAQVAMPPDPLAVPDAQAATPGAAVPPAAMTGAAHAPAGQGPLPRTIAAHTAHAAPNPAGDVE